MSVEFRAIREDEREACLDLWCTVWPGDTRNYFRRYFYGDIEWLPYYTQVAVADGKLVSAVQICRRVVACREFKLTMGGIANVATLPEYRGKGFNTECLRRALAVMEADAMDFSLLFTGINGYYARLGYATLPWNGVQGTIRADFRPRPTRCTVRPAADGDLPAIRAIYDAYNRTRPIAVQRYEAYWRDWLGIAPGRVPETLHVAVAPDGAVCGYVWYDIHQPRDSEGQKEPQARITELGVSGESLSAPEKPDVTAALLEAISARFLQEGIRRLRLDIALESAVLGALENILETREWRTNTGGMVRLLHRDNLLRSFTIALNERWIAAGRPRGAVTFATPYGPTKLDASGAFLRVEPVAEAADALPQEALFGLLFGQYAPVEPPTADSTLSPLLSALFPPEAAVYWDEDGF
ncbi:MAG TPA: GNAT family N-acetyltransferase [Chthonomonadaceae bacterium]|nr:GNAT family N-acetyltransferase [Chthonomonadaceae bacterium]